MPRPQELKSNEEILLGLCREPLWPGFCIPITDQTESEDNVNQDKEGTETLSGPAVSAAVVARVFLNSPAGQTGV